MPSELQQRQQICEIGQRVYQRGFVNANEGNISTRLDTDRVLCTPTLICKGFMAPNDLCVVDLDGNHLAGERKPTSEILLHLEVYRRRPEVRHVVHCHPPHATAFSVAREPVPTGVLPEPDILLGEVPIAPYETPGNQGFAETISPFVDHTNVIILANHGTLSYDEDLERAFWFTEVLEGYCRVLVLAAQLGRLEYVPLPKVGELLELRRAWGFEDGRPSGTDQATLLKIANFAKFKSTWEDSRLAQRAFFPHPEVQADEEATVENQLSGVANEAAITKLVSEKLNSDEWVNRIVEGVVEQLKQA